ncbi:MAG TPA: AraC family transcriptional regulator [Anaeromyxobacter sp.]
MAADATSTALVARAAIAALEARGIDAGGALRAAQLSREAVSSVEGRVPYLAVRALWEAAAEAAGDPSFGVHVAEALPIGALDVLDYVMSAEATAGAALSRIVRYVRLVHDPVDLRLVVEPDHARIVGGVPMSPAPQLDEFGLTLLLVRSRQATGVRWTPARMTFQHERVHDDGELSRVFGCPVAFGAREIELRFARSVLDLPHLHADSTLLAVVTRFADAALAAVPSPGDLVARASSAIARRMSVELATLSGTAAALGLPERTLQRRLAEAGVSHSGLVEAVRRELALKHLADARLSIAEIAFLLHFADSTAFDRAFKRWTGEPPAQYRRRLF